MSGSAALLAWPQLALVATFAPASRKSSIFLERMIAVMFMRVNSKCAHQVHPPRGWFAWCSAGRRQLATSAESSAWPSLLVERKLLGPLGLVR